MLLLPFGLPAYLPLKFDRIPVKAWQWIFLFTVYPLIAYVLLTGDAFGLAYVETHLWGGMFLTLVIAVIGIATSLPIGILLALGRRSTMPVTKTLCICFIELIRGVPLISVLFMASIMLPLFLPEGAHFDKLLRALIGVSLFYAAYMAEVVRGGLQAIPKGQYEAAESLGCGYWRMMGLIILPQALRLVIPGIVNTFLGLFKDTTLVAVIGLMDMLGIVKTALADTEWLGFPKEAYVFAAAVFWVFCFSMSRYSMHLEKRFKVRRNLTLGEPRQSISRHPCDRSARAGKFENQHRSRCTAHHHPLPCPQMVRGVPRAEGHQPERWPGANGWSSAAPRGRANPPSSGASTGWRSTRRAPSS